MEKIIQKLKKIKAKKIFIQFGEGLKLKIQEIDNELMKAGFKTVLCGEECYGACDIRDEEALRLGCDTILHIGHEEFVKKTKLPLVYWEYFLEADPLSVLEKEFHKLENYERIGLITSIQFVKTISLIKKYLKQKGKKAVTAKTLQYPGQILGCRLEAAKDIEDKVDCFLCISAGKFYGLGVVLQVNKPVLCLDLERKEIYTLEEFKKKIQKIIAWNKAQLKDAKKVGILISWKKGQIFCDPFKIKEKLEKQGKEVYILAFDEITPEKIEGLKLDFLINCACPRIGIDDLDRYKIPLINFDQLDKS